MNNQFKSITDAAGLLGLKRQTIWQHYRNGKLPNAFMVGTSIAIPQEDLDKLAEYLRFRKKRNRTA